MRRERLSVVANEQVGPVHLLRVTRGGVDPGVPGQFFMLEAPGRLLPRPMSLCLAPRGELAFLIDAIGSGTAALCELECGEAIHVLGPLGTGSTSTWSGRCSSVAGSGSLRCPTCRKPSGGRPPCSFPLDRHARLRSSYRTARPASSRPS